MVRFIRPTCSGRVRSRKVRRRLFGRAGTKPGACRAWLAALDRGFHGTLYTITNCGGTTLTDLAIVDDAGTPGDTSDDFTVVSGLTLVPLTSQSYHVVVTLPIPQPTPLCAGSGSDPSAGTLDVQVLANGDVKVVFRQSRNLNDNVYGTS